MGDAEAEKAKVDDETGIRGRAARHAARGWTGARWVWGV